MEDATTPDLGFAAALVTMGYPCNGIVASEEPGRMLFCFSVQPQQLEVHYRSYVNYQLKVDAFLNAQSLRSLKKLLHAPATT